MGNTHNIQKVNFEDIQFAINNPDKYILINTLPIHEQKCLLPNTISVEKEEMIINSYIKNKHVIGQKNIIIYGKNNNDITIYNKYKQLIKLGFYSTFIYIGGMFEWLLLADIYGNDLFPTTIRELDILKFKPQKGLNIHLLEY
jgi:hypothetical protein